MLLQPQRGLLGSASCDSGLDNDALAMHNCLVDLQTHKNFVPTPVHA